VGKIYVPVHVVYENREKMRTTCKQIYLKYHPEHKEFRITDDFIFSKIVNKYIEDDYGLFP